MTSVTPMSRFSALARGPPPLLPPFCALIARALSESSTFVFIFPIAIAALVIRVVARVEHVVGHDRTHHDRLRHRLRHRLCVVIRVVARVGFVSVGVEAYPSPRALITGAFPACHPAFTAWTGHRQNRGVWPDYYPRLGDLKRFGFFVFH